jgi:hypothetical protein
VLDGFNGKGEEYKKGEREREREREEEDERCSQEDDEHFPLMLFLKRV